MTSEEVARLQTGDLVIRVDRGQSDLGYITPVIIREDGVRLIRHQNGALDALFPMYWNFYGKKPVKKSGFAKFITRVEKI